MRINKHDTNGTKPLLGKGELGYDDYTAGGDTGRVYVGTGTENIALAEKAEVETKTTAMTKAQFNALAEERKANRAGSGFDEWGKHIAISGAIPINDGIFTLPTQVNGFFIGRSSNGIGVSRKDYPVITVNGVSQVLSKILALGNSSNNQLEITLPTAPTIYPYDTVLTTEQIASGVIKHADSSSSGLILMGKNLNGTTFNQTVTVVNGKKYLIEYKDNGVRKTLEITASSTSYIVSLSGTNITEVGMYPLDAISRSDLVFLESWHEDVSEKNMVYPLGNVQYLGSNTDGLTGIVNGAFTGFETYSLFGNWQTPSALIGKGYVWSNLTEAQKRVFIANPENNCYLDGDKVIQVRYRVRVVQGVGDSWGGIDTYGSSALNYNTAFFVKPKGKQVAISDFGTTGSLLYQGNNSNVISNFSVQTGNFSLPSIDTAIAYEGKCFALPIALVHR